MEVWCYYCEDWFDTSDSPLAECSHCGAVVEVTEWVMEEVVS
jgi:hypothetical protein